MKIRTTKQQERQFFFSERFLIEIEFAEQQLQPRNCHPFLWETSKQAQHLMIATVTKKQERMCDTGRDFFSQKRQMQLVRGCILK